MREIDNINDIKTHEDLEELDEFSGIVEDNKSSGGTLVVLFLIVLFAGLHYFYKKMNVETIHKPIHIEVVDQLKLCDLNEPQAIEVYKAWINVKEEHPKEHQNIAGEYIRQCLSTTKINFIKDDQFTQDILNIKEKG